MAVQELIGELDYIIVEDMSTINGEVGGQDGMYQNKPIERIYRTKGQGDDIIRIYVLDAAYGGIALIGVKYHKNVKRQWQVIMLAEDDGYFFIPTNVSSLPNGDKSDTLDMLGRAMSLMNNIKD